MSVDEFLQHFVDRYLFRDLEEMAKLNPPDALGGAGYPMVATTISGMELLGNLVYDKPLDSFEKPEWRGNTCFLFYWDNFLSMEEPLYRGLGPTIRAIVRNGIAHKFYASGLRIEKTDGSHIRVDLNSQTITLDCLRFMNDFRRSYENHVEPIVSGGGARKEAMQERLGELERLDSADVTKTFAKKLDLASLDRAVLQRAPKQVEDGITTSQYLTSTPIVTTPLNPPQQPSG